VQAGLALQRVLLTATSSVLAASFLNQVLASDYDRSQKQQRYAADIAADYDFSRNVRHE